MAIKIFSAPGDHRDDFGVVESQVNTWIERSGPKIVNMRCAVNLMPEKKRDVGTFMLTVVIHYE